MWILFLLDIRKNIRIRGYLYPANHISDAHPLTEIFASESVSGKIYIRIRIREKNMGLPISVCIRSGFIPRYRSHYFFVPVLLK